jgi:hypothetical protein
VGRHQRGVDVEHDPRRRRPGRPGALPDAGSGGADGAEALVIDGVHDTPGGRVRGHRPEEVDLIAQRPKVGKAVAPVGEHHRQVAQDLARIVARATRAGRRHRRAEAICQPEPVGQLDEQNAPGARGHRRVIRRTCSVLLRLERVTDTVILLGGVGQASTPRFSPPSRTSRRPSAVRAPRLTNDPG